MTLLQLGEYWIDPTEGSTKDAFKVYCNGPDTCLKPVKNPDEVNPQTILISIGKSLSFSLSIQSHLLPYAFFV